MSKGKSRSHNSNAELSFYSSLDVEQAANMLSELQSPHLAVTVEPLDAETYRFELGSHLGVGGTVRGTLRHWEGTYTRIEATGDIVRDSDYDAHYGLYNKRRVNKQQNSLIGCFALIILPAYAIFQLTSLPSWVFMLGAVVSLSGMVMMYLMYGENDAEPEDGEQDKVHFRERDALLNTLIKAFQAAGVVAHKPEQLITRIEDLSLNDTLFKSKNA